MTTPTAPPSGPAVFPSALTLPTGIDPTGLVGEVAADGQHAHVSALAVAPSGAVVILSLVGYDTSVSAALACLMQRGAIGFLPPAAVPWDGPTSLTAWPSAYWRWQSPLVGTREVQGMALLRTAAVTNGLQHPPVLPADPLPTPDDPAPAPDPAMTTAAILARLEDGTYPLDELAPRFVLGAPHVATPDAATFFGHLKGLRVITLPRLDWLTYLWHAGLRTQLLIPLPALGLRAWQICGDPRPWNALISAAIQQRLLPTTPASAADRARLMPGTVPGPQA